MTVKPPVITVAIAIAGNFWQSAYNDPLPFLQIDLIKQYRIAKLYVQGASSSSYTTPFQVLYSLDNLTWTGYSDAVDGSLTTFSANNGDEILPLYFQTPFSVSLQYRLINRFFVGSNQVLEIITVQS